MGLDMGRMPRRKTPRVEPPPTRAWGTMDYANWRSLPAMFFDTARQRGDRPFLWAKRDGTYRPTSWSEAEDAVGRLARALLALGVEPGDRGALVSGNRPGWGVGG